MALICFSAWLNPVIFEFAVSKGVSSALATTIATAICSAFQFLIYFPFDKLLMRQKKKD